VIIDVTVIKCGKEIEELKILDFVINGEIFRLYPSET